MGWAREAIAPLVGTVLGGLIATGTTLFANYGTYKKEYEAERRQKLESVISDVFAAHACTNRMLQGEITSESCEANVAGYRSMAYSQLYFPDLYPSVATFQMAQVTLQYQMVECMSKEIRFDEPSQETQRLKCMRESFKDPKRQDSQIDLIIKKARETELTIAP